MILKRFLILRTWRTATKMKKKMKRRKQKMQMTTTKIWKVTKLAHTGGCAGLERVHVLMESLPSCRYIRCR